MQLLVLNTVKERKEREQASTRVMPEKVKAKVHPGD